MDRDVVQRSNLHRQCGFTEDDARRGAPKVEALATHLSRANDCVAIDPRAEDFRPSNALELSRDMTLLLDGTDNVPARMLLCDVSLELRLPWIYCGAVGEEGRAQLFAPGYGPCLRCVLPEAPPPGTLDTCETAGVLGPAAAAAASLQAAMALRVLVEGDAGLRALAGRQVRTAVWSLRASVSEIPRDPDCPACVRGQRSALEAIETDVEALCGRRAVQVTPTHQPQRVDLLALASRLGPLGVVETTPHLLRFQGHGTRFALFQDGRMIVEETTDLAAARAVYARFFGI